MKIISWYIILLAFILSLACDENFVIVKCSDCLASEPVDALVTLETENNYDFTMTVMIYEGNLEDNILLGTYKSSLNVTEYNLIVNKKYTFKVEYTDSKGTRYIAVNTVYPRVKLELDQCPDSPCYYIYDNKLNMHLKYH